MIWGRFCVNVFPIYIIIIIALTLLLFSFDWAPKAGLTNFFDAISKIYLTRDIYRRKVLCWLKCNASQQVSGAACSSALYSMNSGAATIPRTSSMCSCAARWSMSLRVTLSAAFKPAGLDAWACSPYLPSPLTPTKSPRGSQRRTKTGCNYLVTQQLPLQCYYNPRIKMYSCNRLRICTCKIKMLSKCYDYYWWAELQVTICFVSRIVPVMIIFMFWRQRAST